MYRYILDKQEADISKYFKKRLGIESFSDLNSMTQDELNELEQRLTDKVVATSMNIQGNPNPTLFLHERLRGFRYRKQLN